MEREGRKTPGVGTKRAPPRNSILLKEEGGEKSARITRKLRFPIGPRGHFTNDRRSPLSHLQSSDGIKFVARLWIYIEFKAKDSSNG